MDRLPLFVKLEQKPCLVVGGGVVAERKIQLLERSNARITVVAPSLSKSLREAHSAGTFSYIARNYAAHLLTGQQLVIAATSDDAVNRQVSSDAAAANILCNVVDDDDASSFTVPALIDRSPVVVAIGTEGNAPVLAQQLKSQIESLLPSRLGRIATRAGRLRPLVKKRFSSLRQRRRFWQHFFSGAIFDYLMAGKETAAEALIRQQLLGDANVQRGPHGEAWLVGAGPGNPDLITLRAQQLLSRADVVMYDHLVTKEILDFARKDAEFIDVGKQAGGRGRSQTGINKLLVDKVAAGYNVCRLKGGDPFIFGRGGEEAKALSDAGLPFQVCPGITAALGAAAYAGIPMTMRGVSASVTLATGQLGNDESVDWQRLLAAGDTLAIYMAVSAIPSIRDELLDNGVENTTPVAFVENGTRPTQRTILTDVGNMSAAALHQNIQSPTMLYIGDTAAYSEQFRWVDETVEKPHGSRVTRTGTM